MTNPAELSSRERVRQMFAADPSLTLSEVARALGISRERVRQLVIAVGIDRVAPRRPAANRPGPQPQARVITGGVPVALSGTVAGTIAELLAAADLAARGFAVFLPLVRTEMCDLIILDRRSGEVARIEVRSGSRRDDGRIVWRKSDTSRSDRRAIVLTGEGVRYEPPFSGEPESTGR